MFMSSSCKAVSQLGVCDIFLAKLSYIECLLSLQGLGFLDLFHFIFYLVKSEGIHKYL
jgi:hypothetical protein